MKYCYFFNSNFMVGNVNFFSLCFKYFVYDILFNKNLVLLLPENYTQSYTIK